MTASILRLLHSGVVHRDGIFDLHRNVLRNHLYHNLLRAVQAWLMWRTDLSAGSNNFRLGGTRCTLVKLFDFGFNANCEGPK